MSQSKTKAAEMYSNRRTTFVTDSQERWLQKRCAALRARGIHCSQADVLRMLIVEAMEQDPSGSGASS